jgi:hypothetical protein
MKMNRVDLSTTILFFTVVFQIDWITQDNNSVKTFKAKAIGCLVSALFVVPEKC